MLGSRANNLFRLMIHLRLFDASGEIVLMVIGQFRMIEAHFRPFDGTRPMIARREFLLNILV